MEINPGISRSDATPGLLIGSADLAKSGFILDTVVSTATITNYVKVKKCTAVNTNSQGATGTFQGGETITGGVSGFTGTFRGSGTPSMSLEVADIASGDTSLKFNKTLADIARDAVEHGATRAILEDDVHRAALRVRTVQAHDVRVLQLLEQLLLAQVGLALLVVRAQVRALDGHDRVAVEAPQRDARARLVI